MAERISEEKLAQIRNETNIIDVVSQYVQLKKRGKNHFGFCPFHDEKTPSFSVAEEKQIFHCFSCGRGGNVFTFLMDVEGISFVEAVIKTAELSNIPLDFTYDHHTQDNPMQSKKEKLVQIHEEAAAFYHQILMNTVTGQAALDYMTNRGFTQQTMQEYQIGFSPSNRTALFQMLKAKKFDEGLLQESGIFTDRQGQNELFDRFSGRIIFPLRNAKGQTAAFSGRIMHASQDDETGYHEAKYLNSPETLLFNKRDFLFNFDKARSEIRRHSEVVLFEGYMDVISAWQAGVKNGVASMGTSLTDEQNRILTKTADKIVIAYDGDRAGVEATKRAIEILERNKHFDISVFPLEAGMDPDEYIQQKGPEAFAKALKNNRETVIQFYSRYLKMNLNLDSEKNRITYIETMLKALASLDSLIERELYMKDIAEEFGIPIDILQKQLKGYQQDVLQQQPDRAPVRRSEAQSALAQAAYPKTNNRKATQAEQSEKQLLYRLFHFEEVWSYLQEIDADFNFIHDDYQTIYILYEAFFRQNGAVGNIDQFLDRINNPALQNLITQIEWFQLDSEVTYQEIRDLVHIIRDKSSLQEQLTKKQAEMKEARKKNDNERLKSIMSEIVSLSKELKATPK
ncbi:DNA primase [Trichococcus ilyis]|uniref:DNA primase n=1 Tax=Trichococcus ilyis TaxID=640938 RepID=A0A143Y7W4_9LACT|nr:DNA primase [Trichococcus ilyis]CZQ81930.1 zinc finger chc2-type [Trichococcus ilyis]SEI51677.1 DNA primase [Trichococcus ilyis]